MFAGTERSEITDRDDKKGCLDRLEPLQNRTTAAQRDDV